MKNCGHETIKIRQVMDPVDTIPCVCEMSGRHGKNGKGYTYRTSKPCWHRQRYTHINTEQPLPHCQSKVVLVSIYNLPVSLHQYLGQNFVHLLVSEKNLFLHT